MTAADTIRDSQLVAEEAIRQDVEDFAGEGVEGEETIGDEDDVERRVVRDRMSDEDFCALVCGEDRNVYPGPKSGRLLASQPLRVSP